MPAIDTFYKKQFLSMKLLKYILSLCAVLTLSAFSSQENGSVIVFAGDSITDGAWGGGNGTKLPTSKRDHSDMNHIYGHSYMMLCAARLSADFPEQGLKFFNRGISSNTLANLEDRWADDVLSLSPDIISILIGTNDIQFYLLEDSENEFDFTEWEARYRNLLDQALEVNPQVRFMLGTPFTAPTGKVGDSVDYEKRAMLLKQMDEVIAGIAKDYNAKLLRCDEIFESLYEKYPEVSPSYWIWDGIHPTPAGHQAIADAWLEEFYNLK